jgi:hypothetical protein
VGPLRPHARPVQEPEYQQLVDLYFEESGFRALVRGLADGLGLQVLDVSLYGVVLEPTENSVFALKPSAYRSGNSADDRLLDGLVQVAIAVTIFPRARDLDESPDLARAPVTVEEVQTQIQIICDKLAEEARSEPDPEAADAEQGLIDAWRVYKRYTEAAETKDGRRSPRAVRSIILYNLERLHSYGCFMQVRDARGLAWQPTRKYQVQVQQLAATRIYYLVQQMLQRGASEEGMD